MTRNTFLACTLLLSFCTQSCVTPIEFTNPNNEETLAVYGELTQEAGPTQIRLTRTTGFKNGIQYILGAKVTLYENNLPKADYQPIDTGIYKINYFEGTVGNSYFVRIETGGQIYESTPERMLAPIQPDYIQIKFDKYYYSNEYGVTLSTPIWNIYGGTQLPEAQEVYLREGSTYAYSFTESNNCHFRFGSGTTKTCYFTGDTDPLHISLLYKPQNTTMTRADNLLIATRVLDRKEVKEKEYFSASQFRINKSSYDYWQKINLQNNQSGGIFDPYPASVPGNIHNKGNAAERVLGIFEISGVGRKYDFITNGDAPEYYKSSSCEEFNGQSGGSFADPCDQNTSPCFNCLLLKNATDTKPDFWR